MTNSTDIKKAIDLIDKSTNILITTHTRPDGDACGCIAAMADVLVSAGKTVKSLILSGIPDWYQFLFTEKVPVLGKDITLQQLRTGEFLKPDLIIIVDTNSVSQLPIFEEFLKQSDKPVLVIDHHVTTDNLGDVELIDTTAAAAGIIVFDLLKSANLAITPKIAQALFVAITADTGWFQFNNTDSRVHRICAELINIGVKPATIYRQLYQNFSSQRFKLLAAMLNSLELHFDDRYASQCLTKADFQRTGAKYSDTENLIDECRRIATVEAAALFVELPDGKIKCSLRSTGDIDVRQIAQKFGGGGHKMASGTNLPSPLETAQKLICDEIEKQLYP
jgi:bifunctional oligoribonuclease and PAP phosphatase NrnA